MLFSQRRGLKRVSSLIQRDSMSEELRNSLWNVLHLLFWQEPGFCDVEWRVQGEIDEFSRLLWSGYFKRPVDERKAKAAQVMADIRKYFFECEWHEVYDFLEFFLRVQGHAEQHIIAINAILEVELSAYRYVGGCFSEITSEEELSSLQEALDDRDFPGVATHLSRALQLMSDRAHPDPRNSIKESISAVESACKRIAGRKTATLADALKVIAVKHELHPSLKNGFAGLYNYTSDEDGIRHAILDEPSISIHDAKFFVVSCSAFINYLKSKV